jgi:glycosyltransferase involved in cell wall biosynthesis
MKVGACIVTIDRPTYLKKCIESLNRDVISRIVVVDNGFNNCFDICRKLSVDYINGHNSNSPHGQNLGLEHLRRKGCDAILKSDDDLVYEELYVERLIEAFHQEQNVVATGGVCWSNYRPLYAHHEFGKWYDEKGENVSSQFMMHRLECDSLIVTNYLHGGFLYFVDAAMRVKEMTEELRGGAFGEYFSRIAYREETEFSFLLKELNNGILLLEPDAVSFHHYAPGGIRGIINANMLEKRDEKMMQERLNKLGLTLEFEPFVRLLYGN